MNGQNGHFDYDVCHKRFILNGFDFPRIIEYLSLCK